MYYAMTTMNKLRSVLEKKGIAQGTALSAWNDPFWTPTGSVLDLICLAFDLQPGDFLFFVKDDPVEVDRVVKMLEAANGR